MHDWVVLHRRGVHEARIVGRVFLCIHGVLLVNVGLLIVIVHWMLLVHWRGVV